MNRKQMMRMTVDCLMTVILLLLMGYSRVGEAAHEWLGISMFLLYIPECDPMDQANACLFLASDMGKHVKGQVIQVCNGAFL